MCASSVIKNLPKVNNRPLVENSPNLVTLFGIQSPGLPCKAGMSSSRLGLVSVASAAATDSKFSRLEFSESAF
jgi:hypothetical protein